jgi:hypothetical protein
MGLGASRSAPTKHVEWSGRAAFILYPTTASFGPNLFRIVLGKLALGNKLSEYLQPKPPGQKGFHGTQDDSLV